MHLGHPRSGHTCGDETGSAEGSQAAPRVRKPLDGTARCIVDAILNAQDVNKFQLGDTRKEEKHQTGWEPKAAQERAKSSVNSQERNVFTPLFTPEPEMKKPSRFRTGLSH